MLDALGTYYGHNYAGIIGWWLLVNVEPLNNIIITQAFRYAG